jgi:3-methylcrotonyl-CoA carboxylase alpha subunit
VAPLKGGDVVAQRYRVSRESRPLGEVEIAADGTVIVDGQRFRVTPTGDGRYTVSGDDGRSVLVAVAGPVHALWASAQGQAVRLSVESAHRRPAAARAVAGDMSAPMPATVVKVLVGPGETVTAGTPLVVLEAMKMELPVRATRDGVVRTVRCAVGDLVAPGAPLVELEP